MQDFTLKIQIKADTKEGQSAIENLEKSLKNLDKTLKETSDIDPFKALDIKPVKEIEKESEKLKQVYAQLEKEFKQGKITSLDLARAKEALNRKIKELRSGTKELSSSQEELTKTVKGLVAAYLSLQSAMEMKRFVEDCIHVFADFDDAVRQAAAAAGANAEQMKKMAEAAKEAGRTTRYTATEAAQGLRYLAMAGLSVNEAISALPVTLNLAAAGSMDLARAADIVTNIMTQFGASVRDLPHIADLMTQAFTNANTNLSELGYAFSYVGPIAKSAGQSIEEITATLMALADAGYKGERAGTALRGAIARLIDPTKEAQQVLDKLGITVMDSTGKMRPFLDIMKDLALSGATTADIIKLFGQEAGPAMAALIQQGIDALDGYREKLKDVEGRTKEVAQMQEAGLGGALRRIQALWESYQIKIGEAIAKDGVLIKTISDLVSWLERNSDLIADLVVEISHYIAEVLKAALSVGEFVEKHKELVKTVIEYAAKIYILIQAFKLYKAVQGKILLLNIADYFVKATISIEGMKRALQALYAASADFLILWAGYKIFDTINNMVSLYEAMNNMNEAQKNAILYAGEYVRKLQDLSAQTNMNITNFQQFLNLVNDGTLVWNQASQSWTAAIRNMEGEILSFKTYQQELNSEINRQQQVITNVMQKIDALYTHEATIYKEKITLYGQDVRAFNTAIDTKIRIIDMFTQTALQRLNNYVLNSKQAEWELLTSRQRIWQNTLQDYQLLMQQMIQEEENRKKAILLIEDEIRRAREQTSMLLRELKRQEMTDEEAYYDRLNQIEEMRAKMKQSIIEGNLEQARQYYNEIIMLAQRLDSGIKKTIETEINGQKVIQENNLYYEARQQKIQTIESVMNEYISLLEKEKQKHQEILNSIDLHKNALQTMMEDVKKQIQQLSEQKIELQGEIKLETEQTKMQAQQLKQEIETILGNIKAQVNIYGENAKTMASILKQEIQNIYNSTPIKMVIDIDKTNLNQEAMDTILTLEKIYKKNSVKIPGKLDKKNIIVDAQKLRMDLEQTLSVQGKPSLDTSRIKTSVDEARNYITSRLSVSTQSMHNVRDNVPQVRQEILSLNGIHTYSYHTIYVQKVEQKATGGMVLSAIFRRRRGYIPGWGSKDDVPALLQRGEYVIRKEAVRKYGLAFIEAINKMKIPPEKISGIRKFATGGFVEPLSSFIDSAIDNLYFQIAPANILKEISVPEVRRKEVVINLHLPNVPDSFRLHAEESVMDRLVRELKRSNMATIKEV